MARETLFWQRRPHGRTYALKPPRPLRAGNDASSGAFSDNSSTHSLPLSQATRASRDDKSLDNDGCQSVPNDDMVLRETRCSMSRAVKAATRDKVAEPDEKHVTRVCKYARENMDKFKSLAELFEEIDNKMRSTCVNVALKANMLFHTVVMDCPNTTTDDKYQMWHQYVAKYPNGVPLLTSPKMPPVLVGYNRYLAQRMADFRGSCKDPIQERLHRLPSSQHDSVLALMASVGTAFPSATEVLDLTQIALTQGKLIMECDFRPQELQHPLYVRLYDMLAVDLSILFRFLNTAMVFALQSFFSLTRSDAQRTLFIYKEFMQLHMSDDILQFVSIAANNVNPRDLEIPPALQQDDTSIKQLTRALESYLYSEQNLPDSKRDSVPHPAPPRPSRPAPPPPKTAASLPPAPARPTTMPVPSPPTPPPQPERAISRPVTPPPPPPPPPQINQSRPITPPPLHRKHSSPYFNSGGPSLAPPVHRPPSPSLHPPQRPLAPPTQLPPSPSMSGSPSLSDANSTACTITGPARQSELPLYTIANESFSKNDEDFTSWLDSVIGTDTPHFDFEVQDKITSLTTFYDQLDSDISRADSAGPASVAVSHSHESHLRIPFSKSISSLFGFKKHQHQQQQQP